MVASALQALRSKQDEAQAELEGDLMVLRNEVEAFEEIRSELGVLADAFQVRCRRRALAPPRAGTKRDIEEACE